MEKMSFNTLIDYLNIEYEHFEIVDKYYYGYEKLFYFNGIKIWLNFKKNTCLLDCSGKGCRTLESLNLYSWEELILVMVDVNASFTRLDLALDVKKTLEYKIVLDSVMKRKYISNTEKLIYIEGTEQSIYFGSPASRKRLRIYNKALERGVDGNWVRFELQLRKESILTFLECLKNGYSILNIHSGMMIKYVRFLNKTYEFDNHPERYKTALWYKKILAQLEKIKDVTIGKLEYNLESLEKYLKEQVASSIRTLLTFHDGDTSKLYEYANAAKFNTHQKAFLKAAGKDVNIDCGTVKELTKEEQIECLITQAMQLQNELIQEREEQIKNGKKS